jgi:hypothetical protein
VLYLADDPTGGAIIDRGLFWNWAIPALLLFGAALLGWLFVYMLSGGVKRQVPNGPPLPA